MSEEPLVPQQELFRIELPSGESFHVMISPAEVLAARKRAGELGFTSLSEYLVALIEEDLRR